MHIPAAMLNGAICPVTVAVSAAGVSVAYSFARKSINKPSVARFVATTALIFVAQMLNYPVQDGTSGHLMGAMLGVGLLGVPFAVLSMAIVLVVQAFFFGDGGVNALGANILNMALIGTLSAGIIYQRLVARGVNEKVSLGMASFFSIVLAAVACSLELAVSKTMSLGKVLPAMISIHGLIGFGEAALTVALVSAVRAYVSFCKENEQKIAFGMLGLIALLAFLAPLASSFPDGLEWVAEKYSAASFAAVNTFSLFQDYQVTGFRHAALSTVMAAFLGAGIVSLSALACGVFLKRK